MTDAEQITDVLSVGATFTVIEQASENLDLVRFADEEIAVVLGFPLQTRAQVTLRLSAVADQIRDALLELDGRLLQLTARAAKDAAEA